MCLGQSDIWTALLGIVSGQGFENDLRPAAGQPEGKLSQFHGSAMDHHHWHFSAAALQNGGTHER